MQLVKERKNIYIYKHYDHNNLKKKIISFKKMVRMEFCDFFLFVVLDMFSMWPN